MLTQTEPHTKAAKTQKERKEDDSLARALRREQVRGLDEFDELCAITLRVLSRRLARERGDVIEVGRAFVLRVAQDQTEGCDRRRELEIVRRLLPRAPAVGNADAQKSAHVRVRLFVTQLDRQQFVALRPRRRMQRLLILQRI